MDAAGHDVHDRLRGERGLQRVPVRASRSASAIKTDHHETLINARRDAGLPAAAGPAAGRADRRQRLHPAVLPRASSSRTAARRSCRSAKAPTRISSATGGASTTGRRTSRSISRRGSRRRGGVRSARRSIAAAPRCRRGSRDQRPRASCGEELFWGGAVCWWGEMRRPPDAGCRAVPRRRSTVRSPGLLPASLPIARQPRGRRATISRRSTAASTSRRCCRRSRTWK